MRICLECFAISDDGAGSENRAGYRWLLDVAKISSECVLVTRPECKLEKIPSNCKVVRVSERKWVLSNWLKLIGLQNFLRYKLWCHDVCKAVSKLETGFDVAIHATWGNLFLGTDLVKLGIPTVIAGGGLDSTPKTLKKFSKSFFNLREMIIRQYRPRHWSKISLAFVSNLNNYNWLKNKVKKVEILPDAIPANLGNIAQSYKSNLKQKKILWMSGVSPRKGGEILQEAWALSSPKNITLHIAGRDSFNGKNVFSHGFLDQERLLRLLGESFAVLVPSFREGFPTAAAEAYSIGVPVICFEGVGPAAMGEKTAAFAVSTSGDPIKNFADVLSKIDADQLDLSENIKKGLELAEEFWGDARTEKIKKALLEITRKSL